MVKDDPHIRNIVGHLKRDRDSSGVAVVVATMKALQSVFSGTAGSISAAPLIGMIKQQVPDANAGQIGVALRHYHRTGVIVLSGEGDGQVIRPGGAFAQAES